MSVADDESTVTLRLKSDKKTKQMFLYAFDLEYTIAASEGGLKTELKVTNKSGKNMPIAPGFHPYFNITIGEKAGITTNIDGFDPKTFDWKSSQPFVMPQATQINYTDGQIVMEASPEFKTMMVWSERDRNHVCFEPWIGDVNALLDPNTRIEIAPNDSKTLSLEIKYQKMAE